MKHTYQVLKNWQVYVDKFLGVLKTVENETVDLIYVYPPFFQKELIKYYKDIKALLRSFEDRFSGGIEHYIG